MNMEFHRWWSILLYRGHVPLSPFLYLSNPFLTFRFYFIFCYLHVCVFPQIIRWSIEIPILSFLLFFSPLYIHVVCIAVWRTSWSFAFHTHRKIYLFASIVKIVTVRVSRSLLSLLCLCRDWSIACLSWPSFQIMESFAISKLEGSSSISFWWCYTSLESHRESLLRYWSTSPCRAHSRCFVRTSPISDLFELLLVLILFTSFVGFCRIRKIESVL